MNYIEEVENHTKTYEIEKDNEKLKEIVALLDRDCSVIKYGFRTTKAHNKDKAVEVIKKIKNNANEKENLDFDVLSLDTDTWWYEGEPYDAKYEAVYKGSVRLVELIKWFLDFEKNFSDSITKKVCDLDAYCSKYYNELLNYGNSIDFVPFEKRIEIASKELTIAFETKKYILEATKKYAYANIEARLNPNYDFNRLQELYNETLKCFNPVLVEEVIKYKRTK